MKMNTYQGRENQVRPRIVAQGEPLRWALEFGQAAGKGTVAPRPDKSADTGAHGNLLYRNRGPTHCKSNVGTLPAIRKFPLKNETIKLLNVISLKRPTLQTSRWKL